MPKRKQQKIKKKKGKSKKQQANKCNVRIPLYIASDCKDRVEIEAKNKNEILFVVKCKHFISFTTPNASSILVYLDDNMKRWDIICNIASWCNSFNKDNIDDDMFWSQYIQTKSKNKKQAVPNKIVLILIQKIKDIFKQCIGSKYYYSHSCDKMSKLADFELELVVVGYFRKNVKNVNNYYIPMDIITLFSSFYGYLSKYSFDVDKNILFVLTDNEQRSNNNNSSPFVYNGQYAIHKKGYTLNSIDRTEFKFCVKVLKSMEIFGIGVGIYNKEMSDNLMNGKWILNKDKYFENNNKNDKYYYINKEIKYLNKIQQNMKWNVNDICTLVVSFGRDSMTEYTVKWLLSITMYKNNNLIHREILITDDLYFKNDNNEYKDIKRICHVLFDNKPLSTTDSSLFSLQLIESIDSSIIDIIEWWRNLNVGDIIFYLETTKWSERSKRCQIKYIDGDNNNLLTLKFGYGDNQYFKQIERRNPRILSDERFLEYVFYKTDLNKITVNKLDNVFFDTFQFVAFL